MYRIKEYTQHGDSRVAVHYGTLDMRTDDTLCRCVCVDIRRDQVRSVVYRVPSEPEIRALLSVLVNEGYDIALRRVQSHILKVQRRP